MTSFLDKVSFLGAEVGQGTDLWRNWRRIGKHSCGTGRLLRSPSPSLAIYLRWVELISFTCCVPATTYHFPPYSWNSQCPAPTVYFSSSRGINLSVPREQTASFAWWPAKRCYLTFTLSFVSAWGTETKLHLRDNLGPESSYTEIAPLLLVGLSHPGRSVCNTWQILLTMTEKAGGEQPKSSTIAKQVLRPDSALPGNPSGMHDQFGFGTEYSL